MNASGPSTWFFKIACIPLAASLLFPALAAGQAPSAPGKPYVVPGSTSTALDVSWDSVTGAASYDIRYSSGDGFSGPWSDGPQDQTGTSTTITGLDSTTPYYVAVRASNTSGDSSYSTYGIGHTGSVLQVSNTGTTSETAVALSVNERIATAFTTGPGTWVLGHVGLKVSGWPENADGIYSYLVDADGSGDPVGQIGTSLYNPPRSTTSERLFAAQGVVELAGSTKYFVMITQYPHDNYEFDVTEEDDEDSGSATGWSIENDGIKGYAGAWEVMDATLKMSIYAYPKPVVNSPPMFADSSVTFAMNENISDVSDVGTPVTATDADSGDTLEYSLSGTDSHKFTIDSASAQIRTKAGQTFDYESLVALALIVTATDGKDSATADVTVNLNDLDEPPPAPAEPTVTGASPTSLAVSWTVVDSTGIPSVDTYKVQYQLTTAGNVWTDHTDVSFSTSTTIEGLTASTTYNVRIKATNDEGESAWSDAGSGDTLASAAPMFSSRSYSRSVDENTGANENVGSAIVATDEDTDTLAYTLTGTDAGSFDVGGSKRCDPSEIYGKAARLALRKGDIVRCVTATGGGWGRPEDRLEDQIAEDLRNDFLTAEQAATYKA